MKGSGREREGVGQTGPQASARLFGARDSCHCNASLSGRADVLLYSFGTERSVLSISCPSPPPSTIHLHLRLIVCNHAPLQTFLQRPCCRRRRSTRRPSPQRPRWPCIYLANCTPIFNNSNHGTAHSPTKSAGAYLPDSSDCEMLDL